MITAKEARELARKEEDDQIIEDTIKEIEFNIKNAASSADASYYFVYVFQNDKHKYNSHITTKIMQILIENGYKVSYFLMGWNGSGNLTFNISWEE